MPHTHTHTNTHTLTHTHKHAHIHTTHTEAYTHTHAHTQKAAVDKRAGSFCAQSKTMQKGGSRPFHTKAYYVGFG